MIRQTIARVPFFGSPGIASLHIYEIRKIRKMFGGGGN